MKALGLAWREMIRRRRGVMVNLLLVVCVVSILIAVWTLREAMLQRMEALSATGRACTALAMRNFTPRYNRKKKLNNSIPRLT